MSGRWLPTLLVLVALSACSAQHLSPQHNPTTQIFTFSGTVPLSNRAGITHLLAVNGESAAARRVLTPLGADGSFSLPLASNRPWLITLLDATRSGSAMTIARLKSNQLALSTLPPFGAGRLALGLLSLDPADGWATPALSLSDDQLLAALSLGSAAQFLVSTADRVALRYLNADVDGDGVIDALQGHPYQLDFQLGYDPMFNSGAARIDDVTTGFLPASTRLSYTGAGIYVSYPSSLIAGSAGTVTFGGDGVTPGTGDITTSDPGGGSFHEGTAISAVSALTLPGYGGLSGFGVNAAPGSALPSGKYVFSAGGRTLTFGNVTPPSPLGSSAGPILPFVHLVKSDTVCFANCRIASIAYEWRTPDPSGNWVPASGDEVILLASDHGATLAFEWQDQAGANISFRLPNTSVSGSVAWEVSNAVLDGVSPDQFYSVDTSMICHLRLFYDDKLGVRRVQRFYGTTGLTTDCGT